MCIEASRALAVMAEAKGSKNRHQLSSDMPGAHTPINDRTPHQTGSNVRCGLAQWSEIRGDSVATHRPEIAGANPAPVTTMA